MFDVTKTINGSFGSVYDANGNWNTNFNKAEASVDISKETIKVAGSRWEYYKQTTLAGKGTISGYTVTSDLLKQVSSITNDNGSQFVTELQFALDDPDSYGAFRIRLKNVIFDKIPLMSWEVGKVVEESWEFVFSGFDLLDPLENPNG